jgi:metal-responsive CopG/Arc/MetJ family transcriptional regulator
MTVVTCKLPEKLGAQLEGLARQRRVSKSDIVRQALEHHLNQPRNRKQVRALDLVKRLKGSIKGGPKDLATNRKYLEDFGG